MDSMIPKPPISPVRLAALFLIVTVGFAFYRWAPFLVWDDSERASPMSIEHGSEEDTKLDSTVAKQLSMARRAAFFAAPLDTLGRVAHLAFSQLKGGYRPLAVLYCEISAGYIYDSEQPRLLHLFFVGTFYGAFAVQCLRVARRFVQYELSAWFALILAFASPPLAATSWIYMTFPQVLVPLVFCTALLNYWSWKDHSRAASLVSLILLLGMAPWFREILFVLPLLLGYLEIQRKDRSPWMFALAFVALAHAIYPTALLKFVYFSELPLQTMFSFGGSVSSQIGGQSGLRWYAACFFFPLLPPTLWLVGLISGLLPFLSQPAESAPVASRSASILQTIMRVGRNSAPLVLGVATFALYYLGYVQAGFVCCLLIPALAWQQGSSFLAGWFLLLFLPLMRVFTEHIHFLYALVPASIIMARAVELLWLRASEIPFAGLFAQRVVFAMGLLLAVDQSLNIYGAYLTNHTLCEGMKAVADRLRERIHKDDLIVSNVIHGEEIRYRSDFYFRHYWSIPWGISDPKRSLADPALFKKFLVNHQKDAIYCLSVEFPYLPTKAAHRHQYLFEYDIDKIDLGILQKTRGCYPYLDPLRCFVARQYIPFLGAPDLVNDFYTGPTRRGAVFWYAVSANYHLYRVTGTKLYPRPKGDVSLVLDGVSGFNVLKIGDDYHAIPQWGGPFDFDRYYRGDYGARISGSTVEQVLENLKNSIRDSNRNDP